MNKIVNIVTTLSAIVLVVVSVIVVNRLPENSFGTAIETFTNPAGMLLAANSTETSFSAVLATTTEPVDSNVIGMGGGNLLLVWPFGTGTNDETFDLRATCWKKVASSTPTWVPGHLGTASTSISSSVTGDALGETPNGVSDLFVDAILIDDGDSPMQEVPGKADQLPAGILIDGLGCEKVEVDFDRTSADSANLFYSVL